MKIKSSKFTPIRITKDNYFVGIDVKQNYFVDKKTSELNCFILCFPILKEEYDNKLQGGRFKNFKNFNLIEKFSISCNTNFHQFKYVIKSSLYNDDGPDVFVQEEQRISRPDNLPRSIELATDYNMVKILNFLGENIENGWNIVYSDIENDFVNYVGDLKITIYFEKEFDYNLFKTWYVLTYG